MEHRLLYYNDIAESQRFKNTVRVEIRERDYSGSASQIKVQPLIQIGKAGDGREEPIKKKTCILKILSETNLQFEHLFTSDDRKYRVLVYYGGSLHFSGFLESDSYEEPYAFYQNYEIELTARDNLGRLEDIDYLDGLGNRFTGLDTATNILTYVLNQTGSELSFRDTIKIYADGMDETTLTTSQSYINRSGFWNFDDNEPISCLDVLEKILKGFGAQVRQVETGAWEVREQAKFFEDDFINVDDVLPRFLQDRLNFPVVPNETFWLNQSARLALQPAWKSFKLIQDYNVDENIFKFMPSSEDYFIKYMTTPDFAYTITNWNANVFPYVIHDADVGDYRIRIPRGGSIGSDEWKNGWIENYELTMEATSVPFVMTFDALVSASSEGETSKVDIDIISNGNKILSSDGWIGYTNQERLLRFDVRNEGSNDATPTSLKAIIDGIPETGSIKIKLWAVSSTSASFFFSHMISNIKISFAENPIPKNNINSISASVDILNNLNPSDFNINIGEIPEEPNSSLTYLGGLFDSSGDALVDWHRKDETNDRNLLEVVAEGYDLLNNKVSRQISGSLFWAWDLWTNIKDQGRTYMLNSGTWDLVNDQLNNAEFIEVFEYKNTLGAFDDGFDDGFDNSDSETYKTNTIFTIEEKYE